MSASLLPDTAPLILGIAAAVAVLAALVLRRGGRAPAAVAALLAAAAGLGLAALLDPALEWWVGRRAPPGEFDESRWLFGGPWGVAISALALLAGAAVTAMAWIGTRRVTSPPQRAALVGLRAGAAAAALCLFFQPAVELRQVTREPNRVAVLIDDSASMSLADQRSQPTRLERARSIVESSAKTFEAWEGRHKVDLYRFSEDVAPLADLAALSGEGRATLIREALEQLRDRYQGGDLAGVVLISDGAATGDLADGAGGEEQAFLASLEAPVHTVLAARPGIKDVAVADVMADEFAFVRTVFRVEAVIRTTGFEGRRVKVTLSGEGKPMRHKWVELPAGDSQAVVSFEMSPARLGRYVYEISVPPAEGEAVVENNRRAFAVRVIRDKIRVLQVAGRPSWDVRALRGMLKQNPNVDLISFFILRTDVDIAKAANSELSLIRFPTRELFLEQLPSFDLVVLQNFNFGPYGIAPYLDNIRAYVEGGGALAVLGGPLAFGSGDYGGTPVERALPVTLPRGRAGDLLDTRRFRPRLTGAGKAHPITALRADPAENQETWKQLPRLEGANLLRGVRDDAVALAVHPELEDERGKPMPVVVAGQYGKGRTLAVATDSLWRWGFSAAQTDGDEGRAYLRLWENATRWLLDDPDFRYLRAEADRVSYEPGMTGRIDVKLLARDYKPAAGKVTIEVTRGADPDRAEKVLADAIETDPTGRGALELPALEAGVYRVRAAADVEGYRAESGDVFIVSDASAELEAPAPAPSQLERIALLTGGSFLGPAEAIPSDLPLAEPRIVRVDRRRELELWSRPWLLVLALMFLGAEWALRQKWGYR